MGVSQNPNDESLIDLSNFKSTMAFVLRHCRADKDPNNPVDHNEDHCQERQNLVAIFPKPELVNKMNYGGLTMENTVVYLDSTFTFTFALVWRPTEIIGNETESEGTRILTSYCSFVQTL